MKKTRKILMIAFIITTFSFVGLKNANALSIDFGMHEMKYNEWQYYPFETNEYAKKTTWDPQSLNIVRASTAMTNPCPNCTFAARVNRKGDQAGPASSSVLGSTIKMGQTGEFLGAEASVPGDFKIQVERVDFSALKTMIRALWNIN